MEELISQALQEDMHIVVLALYVLGTVLKRIKAVPDCLIPVFLAGIGMVLGYLVEGGVQGVMQGILASGAAVMCNQVIKQMKKDMLNLRKEVGDTDEKYPEMQELLEKYYYK